MAKNDQPIPNAVFLMLKAARLAMDGDMNGMKSNQCIYRGGSQCDKFCVYGIVRSDKKVECLYDMLNDAITSMTEE